MSSSSELTPEPNVIAQELLDFINAAWTPYHAVHEAIQHLEKAGFQRLSEREPWRLLPGEKYYFTRNFSTIVAFAIGKKFKAGNGFWIVGAHTDSPCMKLKPVSKVTKGGFLTVGVQTYGSGLWHTWFDRDLSVAGRIVVKTNGEGEGKASKISHRLVKVDRPIMRVPTLAIHLDREVNSTGFKVNTQSHLTPMLATAIKAELNKPSPNKPLEGIASQQKDAELSQKGAESAPANSTVAGSGPSATNAKEAAGKRDTSPHHSILLQLLAEEADCRPEDICDMELSVCDTQAGVIAGAANEFVFVGRLDNLCMSFCSLKALIDSTAGNDDLNEEEGVRMVALFDHEEVGSDSAQGAGSPVMLDALRRTTALFAAQDGEAAQEGLLERAIQKSFLVSADMAHCLHPNYQDKHDENHQPKMHKGLVIKHNANQRYATNAVTAFLFRELGARHNIPVQDFVVRNDVPCGSTIGPILASGMGIRTVDVGAPQLSMHSCREMCGVDDVAHSYSHFKAFFRGFGELDSEVQVDGL